MRITHPERLLYPGINFTKLDLARYYESIAHHIMPHLKGRPLTLVRCPEGQSAECFYMKHSKVWAPKPLRRVNIAEKTKTGEYLVVDSVPALIGLVQMDVLEIHTWNSTTDHLEQPGQHMRSQCRRPRAVVIDAPLLEQNGAADLRNEHKS